MALPGNPTALADRASTYQASASRIQRAADDLRALAYTSTAKSLDAIRERSGEVAGTLDEAYGRYAGTATATALVEYAAVLRDAHRRADAADQAEATAESYAGQADTRVTALTRHVRNLEEAAAPVGTIEAAERDLADAQRASRGEPSDLAHVLKDAGYVDSLGHHTADSADETVIKVTKVVDADGVARWRVALPSTQEWLSRLNGDPGAVNDLDSNLALMLTPSLRSQYERAVLAAMQQAGVGPNDPVMLVGFSQGGIMAGHLAAYNSDDNWDAVVVAGAPIDSMPIPSTTTVVSVQHSGDPVPRLDSIISLGRDGYAQQSPNWTTINTPSPLAAQGVGGIHNAAAYNSTLAANVGRVPRAAQDELDQYFIGSDNAYGYENTYYSWQED